MEANKFEKYIKKQMRKREIQPSASAWKKVSARLEASEEPKNNRFLWYAVAASFIGLMIISVLIFQFGDNNLDTDIQIVNTEKDELNDVQKDSRSEKENKIEKTINDVEVGTVAIDENSIQEATQHKKEGTEQSFEVLNKETAIVASKGSKNGEVIISELLQDSEESIDLKIEEILAKVDLLEQDNEVVTDAEIDSLLRTAQQELMIEKIFKKDNSVDAIALLTEVEDELDQSFRDQIFKKLKSGFFKVRTAVADRNN